MAVAFLTHAFFKSASQRASYPDFIKTCVLNLFSNRFRDYVAGLDKDLAVFLNVAQCRAPCNPRGNAYHDFAFA